MKNGSYKLLVVDIDGTLVNGSGNISSEDEKALAEARASGIRVSLSTGRGVQASLNIINRLSLDGYHIFCDGALASNPTHGEEVYAQPISKAMVREMVEFARSHRIDLELFSATRYLVERETWSTYVHREFFGVEPALVDFAGIWERERVIKGGLVTTGPEEAARARAFHEHFAERLHFSYAKTPAYPEADFINILSPGVSKGKALEALAIHAGIPLDRVVAVGDGTNDISLLATAGLAIAMGNAAEEVRAVARYVTLDVDHSGVAAAISRFLL